jgi:hypothetical protein
MAISSSELRRLAEAIDRLRGVDAVLIIRDGRLRVVARTDVVDSDQVCLNCQTDHTRVVSDERDEPWFEAE